VRVDVVTLFPELFGPFLETSFVGRAIEQGQLTCRLRSPRDFGLGKHRSVDDTPYGGGSGMVMRVDCLVQTLESLDADAPDGLRARRILMTPQGAPLRQARSAELSGLPAIVLICGRYEGFDERVRSFVDEEISIGDFVLTGGEVPAMAVVESVIRLLPGVLGNMASTHEESHSPSSGGLLEYPHYTRPAEFRGLGVPEVLKGGNHAQIAAWRQSSSVDRTRARRPELLPPASASTGNTSKRAARRALEGLAAASSSPSSSSGGAQGGDDGGAAQGGAPQGGAPPAAAAPGDGAPGGAASREEAS
jgi:tRNA (guanine37-N1)-methyltransferase